MQRKRRPLLTRLEDRLLFAGDLPEIHVDGSDGVTVFAHVWNQAVHLHDAGDLNGDGFDDIVLNGHVGPGGELDGGGAAYVVFGAKDAPGSKIFAANGGGEHGFVLPGYRLVGRGNEIAGIGDTNSDGIDDLGLIRMELQPEPLNPIFQVDILYGSSEPFDPVVDLSTLAVNPQLGFSIVAEEPMHLAGGDVNGDGLADIVIGSDSSPNVFVVFGAEKPTSLMSVSDLNGINGFAVRLGEHNLNSTADINGDGLADLLVASNSGGEAYVIFGSSDPFMPLLQLEDLDGTNGFIVRHQDAAEIVGLGDVNMDGVDDFAIVGSFNHVQVVFGSNDGFPREMQTDLLDSSQGFRIDGFRTVDDSYPVVTGPGDVNGDGVDDILLGNPDFSDGLVGDPRGEVYVLFGGDAVPTNPTVSVENITPATGFGFIGSGDEFSGDALGDEVSRLGDFNGDGINDLFIGPQASNGDGRGIVVFGKPSPTPGDLNDDGAVDFEDFVILANNFGKDNVTYSEGDIDGDGSVRIEDFIILAKNFGR